MAAGAGAAGAGAASAGPGAATDCICFGACAQNVSMADNNCLNRSSHEVGRRSPGLLGHFAFQQPDPPGQIGFHFSGSTWMDRRQRFPLAPVWTFSSRYARSSLPAGRSRMVTRRTLAPAIGSPGRSAARRAWRGSATPMARSLSRPGASESQPRSEKSAMRVELHAMVVRRSEVAPAKAAPSACAFAVAAPLSIPR